MDIFPKKSFENLVREKIFPPVPPNSAPSLRLWA